MDFYYINIVLLLPSLVFCVLIIRYINFPN